MKKFEYTYTTLEGVNQGFLDDMGKLGWELITVVYTHGQFVFFFKRVLK